MLRQRTFLLGEYSSVAACELHGPGRPVMILIGCQPGSSGRVSAFPCRVKRRAYDAGPCTGLPPIVTREILGLAKGVTPLVARSSKGRRSPALTQVQASGSVWSKTRPLNGA